jgi:recombination protein RecT
MSTQMVSYAQKIQSVRALLEKSKGQITLALPRHLTADRLMRVAMTSIQRNPKLLDCTQQSLIGAIIQAAQLGLEPDGLGARAYLIPRKNSRKGGVLEANFQVGYLGLMDLARRSHEIASFEAREVYAGDKFVFAFGLRPRLDHAPGGETDEAKITHVYAIAHLLNGRAQFEVLTRAQVDAHRGKYAKDGRDDSAWSSAWPAMAKKTCIVKLCKYLPASIELQTAVALVERDEIGLPQDLGVELPSADPAGSTLDRVTAQLSEPVSEREALLAALEIERTRLNLSAPEWRTVLSDAGALPPESADVAVLTDLLAELKPMAAKGPTN